MNKRGLKQLSYPLFGEKWAKYVIIMNDFIDCYQKAREALQKNLIWGGQMGLIENPVQVRSKILDLLY